MKRLILLLALVGVSTTLAFGQKATVNNTVHDITKHTGATEKTTISCTNCHTPHVTNTGAPLLWARSYATTATFNAYTGTTVVTETNITLPGAVADPMWRSYLCMSCHDNAGSVSDAYLGSTGLTFHFGSTTKWTATTPETDHPVNFDWSGSLSGTDYNTPASGKLGNLPVYTGNGKTDSVQCATCHNVHAANYVFNPSTPPAQADRTFFLRTPVAANLCLECHK